MTFRFLPKGLFRAADRYSRRLHLPTKGVLGYRPLGTKPRPSSPPPSKKEDRYGDGNTIHDSKTVDVEIGPTGEVCAVWFRCRMLPFVQHDVVDSRVASMLETPPEKLSGIKAIVFDTQIRRDA